MGRETRHSKKVKQPRRKQPMDFTEEGLRIHRELRMLAVAGNAKPGQHRDKLLAQRMRKLDRVEAKAALEAREEAERKALVSGWETA